MRSNSADAATGQNLVALVARSSATDVVPRGAAKPDRIRAHASLEIRFGHALTMPNDYRCSESEPVGRELGKVARGNPVAGYAASSTR